MPQWVIMGLVMEDFETADGLTPDKWALAVTKVLALPPNEEGQTPGVTQFAQGSSQPFVEMLRAEAALFAGETNIPVNMLGIIHENPASDAAMHTAYLALNKDNESVQRSGGKVRYARMVMGATSCDFCLVLASRGPVYGSAETAGGEGNKYHDHCDCVPVPVVGRWVVDPTSPRGFRWEGQSPGYDFEELYAKEYKPYWQENDTIHQVLARRREARAASRKAEKRHTRKASADGTLQREKWNAYREFAKDLAKQRGIKIDGKQYRLPPRTWTEPPPDWPEDLPALRAKEWNHILYGDKRGGGHSSGYGWINGRTEFGAEWTNESIGAKLRELLQYVDFQNVRISELFTVSEDGVKYAIGVARKRGKIRVTTFYILKD